MHKFIIPVDELQQFSHNRPLDVKKRSPVKKGLGTFVLLWLLIFLSACEKTRPTSTLERILDDGVLKVGTNYGLTTYFNGATGPEGFEYELAEGFAEYLGVRLEVFPYYTLNELFPQLSHHHLDLIAAGISVTPERYEQFRFGPAYQNVSQKLVFKQGNVRPRSAVDLTEDILVIAGSSHAETLRTFKPFHPNLNWQETDEKDAEELMEMVLNDELAYTIVDSNILAVLRRRHPELSIGFTINQEQGVAWALDKAQDDSLLAALIEYFGQIQTNGRLAALEDKYFGHVRLFNYVDTREFIRSARTVLPTYRHLFEQYANDIDWRLLAAMSYQESHWDPQAKSATGVRGMMMLTLATARDLDITSRLDPEQSIRGGTDYFSQLLKRIPARIQEPDRIWFALAAYNIGLGHLEDARVLTQKQGGNPDMWIDVKKRLPQLRQKKYYKTTRYGYARGDEAVSYVDNIRRYYDTLVWIDEQDPLTLDEAQIATSEDTE
ncbi:membrane-bound lytic murein transglycosylase MltF [Aliiglaciecola sp. LCG003]|uniref:membrane-bound lytic murein transglycosylase MltF n=1 Tax=Aliiglaciecola sp. LCG003 TaxID=3053655 RepID=UPI002572DD06|nr:membrane-bound lytic murein transglycosylase MltF [Aliiglaciecola sp. LCG003]WJG10530.1 membrane-bound lytic murein transglycosylase MltF [Aliiglaciecola sp. LCG003]